MKAVDATRPTIHEFNLSPFALSMSELDDARVGSTPRPPGTAEFGKAEGALRDASERDDRQVLSAATVLDAQLNYDTRASSNKRVRSDAGRSVPALAGTSCPVLDFSSLDRATGENMAIAKNAAIS